MIKKLVTAALLMGLLSTTAATAIERGGKMTFARYDDSVIIDPVYSERNPDLWLVANLYDTLLRTEADGKTISPGLAATYEVASDGLSIRLMLRDGIKFSDGTPITADDVIFSLERARNPDLGPWANLLASVDTVTADGAFITIALKNRDPALVSILATFNTGIVSKAAFEAAPGATDQEKAQALFKSGQVSSGPFVLASHTPGINMVFKPNPNYWREGADGKPLPYLDEVDLQLVPDDATRILKLQAGEVDAAEFIPFSRVAELSADPNLRMELFPSTRIIYAPINTRPTKADGSANILSDMRVRQALNYATNKEALIQLVTFGTGTPMSSLMSSQTQLYASDGPLYPYDLEKAKALLAEAGVAPGTKLTFTTLAGSADDATMFTALQQMWQQAGIDLSVEQVDNPTRGAKNRSGEFDIHTYGWVNDVNDPAQVTGWLGYFPQREAVGTGWNNAEFNTLYEASNVEIDPEERAKDYARMQAIYAEEAPLLFLYETPFAVAVSKHIEGYWQSSLGANDFASAWRAQ